MRYAAVLHPSNTNKAVMHTNTGTLILVAALASCSTTTHSTFSVSEASSPALSDDVVLQESADATVAPEAGMEDLARKLTNPVADLYSFPVQFNYDQDLGVGDTGDRWLVNVQPVLPFDINDDWLLISRTILPVISQSDVYPGKSESGIGDTVQSFFASPKDGSDGLVIGVGGVFLLPTATDPLLGAKKWGAGPTGLILKMDGPWTYGALANHIWSFAGESDRSRVDATFMQPFMAYTTPTAYTFALNSESTYDWTARKWQIPFNLIVSRVVMMGKLPVSVGVGVRYWAQTPDAGPGGYGLRFVITPMLPR